MGAFIYLIGMVVFGTGLFIYGLTLPTMSGSERHQQRDAETTSEEETSEYEPEYSENAVSDNLQGIFRGLQASSVLESQSIQFDVSKTGDISFTVYPPGRFQKIEESEPSESPQEVLSPEEKKLKDVLMTPIDELELPEELIRKLNVRSIKQLKDLIQETEEEILDHHYFEQDDIDTIKESLKAYGLTLGMNEIDYLFETTAQPEESAETIKEGLKQHLDQLEWREEQIIRLIYGLDDSMERTYEEVSKMFNISEGRVRKLEENALKKIEQIRDSSNDLNTEETV